MSSRSRLAPPSCRSRPRKLLRVGQVARVNAPGPGQCRRPGERHLLAIGAAGGALDDGAGLVRHRTDRAGPVGAQREDLDRHRAAALRPGDADARLRVEQGRRRPAAAGADRRSADQRRPAGPLGRSARVFGSVKILASPRRCAAIVRKGQVSLIGGRLAGALGFEPRYGGTKNRCLTTWRRPNSAGSYSRPMRAASQKTAIPLNLFGRTAIAGQCRSGM